MLLEPPPSQYDLSFRLFGTPVRVHPLFWVVSAIFGWPLVNAGIQYLAIYVACVFVSILLHEFGHIWAGKAFGSDGSIILYSFGGLAIGANSVRERWQRIVVSLAGPGIQLALYGAIWLAMQRISDDQLAGFSRPVRLTIGMLMSINLYWPLLNLLPVWPLDGGQVTREVCMGRSRGGERVALQISMVVAGFIALHAFLATPDRHIPYLPQSMFAGFLFAMLAVESYQLLSVKLVWRYEEPDDRLPWER